MPLREIFFIAGDPSGDVHASMLAAELQRRGGWRLTGAGGPLMRRAGVQTDFDSSRWAVMGLGQALLKLPAALWTKHKILQLLRQRRPDLLLLVDFGGFNIRVARAVRQFPWPQKIMYFFPPRSWDKTERDWSELARLADLVVTPFVWSAELLRRCGVNVHYVGHPVMDRVQPCEDKRLLRTRLGLPPAPVYIGLMPGSRPFERRLIGKEMLNAARQLLATQDIHFLWSPGLPGRPDPVRLPADLQPHLSVIADNAALLAAADLAIVCMGTTTLEAAAALTPFVAVYKGTALQTWQFKLMRVPTRFYAMPNIILDEPAMPEFVAEACTAANIVQCVRELLAEPKKLAQMRDALQRVREQLGPPGAIARTADLLEAMITKKAGAY